MRLTLALTTIVALVAKASALEDCFATKLGYNCCYGTRVVETDSDGKWGVERNQWCGIIENRQIECKANNSGYPCCTSATKVYATDADGDWSIENGEWCGIKAGSAAAPAPAQGNETPAQGNQTPAQGNETPAQGSETPAQTGGDEKQYDFGYGLKNKPVPSKGCGSDLKLPKTGSFEFQWGGNKKRTVRIDIPDNYDKNKPYRLIFGMHCMGGWAGGVQKEGYYGLKPLDTEKTTIFIAPEGNGNQAPWGQDDYKLFDELLEKMKNEACIDESRVFSTGFSYGSMFSNGLSWDHQKVLRGVAVYETAERNIYLPKHTGQPIAWMGVLGFNDNVCTPEMGRHARDIILEHNSEGGKAKQEKAEEAAPNGPHKCYDYKTVDQRFPVRWCTQSGGHLWDHKDPGQQQSWVPKATWEFFTQF